jgi:hypothetical protein
MQLENYSKYQQNGQIVPYAMGKNTSARKAS